MSDAEQRSHKPPGGDEPAPTADFSGKVLGPGSQIGQFRIEREIGRGGMGIVYLAHDTRLDRQVAMKSLPAEVVGKAEILSRWKREARLLASLNHPNIATIYEVVEEAGGAGYLVLEYVPGDTLAERIKRRGLELEEALSVALQIVEAVSAAHEKGVIHRDLKPGNIKVTPEGKVKVLDFGLAKTAGGEPSDQQSTTTEPGRIMGTPAYMSPEQARGKPVDHRSDIWSFGCVLYEMLTGKIPFKGETSSDTLANVLKFEPDWQALPRMTPANIQVLLRRCLEKNPQKRLQHIGDAVIEISETLNLPEVAPPMTTPSPISFETVAVAKAKPRRMAMIIAAAVIIILSGLAVRLILYKPTQPSSKQIRLVVLPFENLGSPDDEHFAAGITDAITARLAGIHGLGVISRQSAMQYKKRAKHLQVIGKELGVDYILEGTVQRERPSDPNSPVRIIPQLIRVFDDTHVWSDIYDDDMSEIFRVQSDLAERVARALDIALLEPERRALRSTPTQNVEAYEYYLLGNAYYHRGFAKSDLSTAIRMYEKAIDLDSTFALAYAQLSTTHALMYWDHHDPNEERLAKAKRTVETALQLDPDLPEAHLALGYYHYWGHLDYDRALEQFAIARKGLPNNSDLLLGIGAVQRRQGKFEEALVNFKGASELDPRYAVLKEEVGYTCMLLRKYQEAEPYANWAILLAPGEPRAYLTKAQLYVLWQGSTDKARSVLEQASQNIVSLEDQYIAFWSVSVHVFAGEYQDALAQVSLWKSEAFDTQYRFTPKALLYAQINGLMGNPQLEQDYYDSARRILESKIEQRPEDAPFHGALGIAYAGLGRKQDAIREGRLAMELLPVTKEALRGAFRVEELARIYVMVGEYDLAIEQLEYLLSIPSEMSVPLLKLDPVWAPLRDHPRFKRLLDKGK